MRRDSPHPSGQVAWVARYTGRDGKRRIAKPTWNRRKGTFSRKADAQKAIDEAYGLSARPDTLGEYAATWTERYPRSERTSARIDSVTGDRLSDAVMATTLDTRWPWASTE